jgi:membrane-bound serine protease (ClpP class)
MDESYFVLAYVLIAVGFVLLAAELFLPTSGTLFVLSVICIAGGVGMTFYYGSTPIGVITLVAVFILLPTFGGLLLRYWPRTRMGKKMFLSGPEEDATVASMPVLMELEQLRGRFGRAVSDLRPSGVCDFDGWRVDTITEGMMVDAGQGVRCIDVRAGKVIVRPVEKPTLGNLENVDLG